MVKVWNDIFATYRYWENQGGEKLILLLGYAFTCPAIRNHIFTREILDSSNSSTNIQKHTLA